MKVSTVSIVMAIICILSSWPSAESGDTIAIAANNSTAIAVNEGSDATGPKVVVPNPSKPQPSTPQLSTPQISTPQPSTPQLSTPQLSTPQPSTPSNAGSSSGNNGENPESDKIKTTTMSDSEWREEFERRQDEIYEEMKRNEADRDISTLMKRIQQALQRGLCESKIAELNVAMKILMKASGNYDSSVKRAAYNEALDILTRVLNG
ncbi:nuclear transcription factor Y subunit gamma-like [Bactrocera dorsalis]|uniref:Nuclear transcription factor Y subunit gamma-like n=1 Tax=Bactrocera dorsalis TaxID=27457 RepID=A0ABM3J2C4_BACDO|nr:nuclear transcription factor Y subunit gamma-like [Bactrocera dorsalis]